MQQTLVKKIHKISFLKNTLSHHDIGNTLESGNVETSHEVVSQTVFFDSVHAHVTGGGDYWLLSGTFSMINFKP